jgi:hypothetical protein
MYPLYLIGVMLLVVGIEESFIEGPLFVRANFTKENGTVCGY